VRFEIDKTNIFLKLCQSLFSQVAKRANLNKPPLCIHLRIKNLFLWYYFKIIEDIKWKSVDFLNNNE